jgi:hypothetical protein
MEIDFTWWKLGVRWFSGLILSFLLIERWEGLLILIIVDIINILIDSGILINGGLNGKKERRIII